jgi:ribosome biogenesis GTPase A
MKKDMILVLNKIDLAPAPLVLAWKHYFKTVYPNLQVLTFTAFPGYNLRDSNEKEGSKLVSVFRRQKFKNLFDRWASYKEKKRKTEDGCRGSRTAAAGL